MRAALLLRRVERLEVRCKPAAAERVRCVWWRRGEPRPEPAPGERLRVHRWADADVGEDGMPAPSPTEAAR